MAYRPGMFDVSNFLSPFRGDPIGAQKMQANVWSDAAQNAIATGQMFQRMRQARAEQELERQAIGQRAQTAQMQQQHADARTKSVVDQRREAARLKLEREQAEAGGELAGEAAKAFAAGDENALLGIQSRMGLLDPMMRMTLPGQAPQQRVDPNLPSVDEVYPNDPNALTIERGGQQLYGETRDAARQREQDVIGRMISPMQSSPFARDYAPSFEGGVNVAGRGLTGKDAFEAAMKQGNLESDRIARMRGQDLMSGSQQHRAGMQETNQNLEIDKMVTNEMKDVRSLYGVDKAEQRVADFQELERQFKEGVPLQQNIGFLSQIKTQVKGMNSDSDMRYIQRSAGFWNALEKDLDNVINGGALPPGMIEQLVQAQQDAAKLLEVKKNKAGLAVRDRVYSHSLLPISDEQFVNEAHRAYQSITGRQLSPEDLQKELARFRARKGKLPSGPQPASPRSMSTSSSQSFSGAPPPEDSLRVIGGRPPAIPREAPDYDVNAEADDLLGEDTD